MAPRLLRLGLKAGILGGAIYLTVEEGIWKDSVHSVGVYEKINQNVAPYLKTEAEAQIIEPLKAEDLVLPAKQYWNKGVYATCGFLANFSENAEQLAVSGWKYAMQLSEASKQKQESTPESKKETKANEEKK